MKMARGITVFVFAVAIWTLLVACSAEEYVQTQILDPLDSAEGWTVGGSNQGPATKLGLVSQPSRDGLALALDYEFTGKADALNYCEYLKSRPLPTDTDTISFWAYGDASGHSLRIRIRDSSGQYLQYNLGIINWYGWKQVTADLALPDDHWGGDDNGIVNWPASFLSFVIDTKSKSFIGSGRIYVDVLEVGKSYLFRPLLDSFDAGTSNWRASGSIVLATSNDRIEGTGALAISYSNLTQGQKIELQPQEPFPIAGFPIRASLFVKGNLQKTQLVIRDGKGQELVLDLGPAVASQYSQLSLNWSRDVKTTVTLPLLLVGIRLYPGNNTGTVLLDNLNSQTITWQAADATGIAGQRFNLPFAFTSDLPLQNFTVEATAYQHGAPVATGKQTVSGGEISATLSFGPMAAGAYELVWSGVENGFRFALPPVRLVVLKQKQRATGKPFFGLQTHYAQGKGRLPDNLDLVVQAGGQIIRDEVYWHRVEKSKGVFTFPKEYDDYIAAAAARNLDIVMILSYGNPLYGLGAPVTNDQLAAWAEYVRQVVSRYKDQVQYWEVWNEFSHGGGLTDEQKAWPLEKKAEAYFKLLQVTYPIIKELDPDSTVIGFANAGTDLPFIEAVFALGGDAYMDAVSVHPYRQPRPPETSNLLEDLIAVKEFIGDKGLWCTEIGWPTHRAGGVDEETQAAYLARMYTMLLGAGFIEAVIWYDLQNDGTDPFYNEHNFGIITYDFTPKPAYWAYGVVTDALLGAEVTPQKQGEDGLWLYSFITPEGKKGYALWSLAGVKTVQLPEQGTWLRHEINGEIKTLASAKNGLAVEATANPVFLLPAGSQPPTQKLAITPNPARAREVLKITYHGEPCRRLTARLYNLAGAQVKSFQAQGGSMEFPTEGLQRGAYLLHITVESEQGTLSTERRMVLIL